MASSVSTRSFCNPCCCWGLKDGAVTVGLWSMVYTVMELAIFSWQSYAIKYERDLAANHLIAAHNTYGDFKAPTYFENYYENQQGDFFKGLFIIQILCLIASFFLLFASIALIYGAHTFSRCLIWPWIPCMLASILCSLAYCIMWWTGDVRDYWLVLTILIMITILINFYCLAVIIIFYQYLSSQLDYYNKKTHYAHYDNRILQDNKSSDVQNKEVNGFVNPEYGKTYQPTHPLDEFNRLTEYNREPHALRPKSPAKNHVDDDKSDRVSSWVHEQRLLKLGEHANSEPASPTKPEKQFVGLQHSLSVPSMYCDTDGTLQRHRSRHKHRHHHHQRHHHHRRRSRYESIDGDLDRKRHHRRRHSKHRHRSHASTTSSSSPSVNTYFTDETKRRRHRSRSRDRYINDASESDDSREKKRRRRRRSKERNFIDERKTKKSELRKDEIPERQPTSLSSTPLMMEPRQQTNEDWAFDGTGGITIPQHIIIPPSKGNIGPDGQVKPQTYQINSEIRISYDQFGRPSGTPVTAVLGPRSSASLQRPSPTQSAGSHHRTQLGSITSVV